MTDSLWVATKYLGTTELEEKEHRVFLFFHHDGQFLVPGSMNSLQLRYRRELKQLFVQISGTEIISDETQFCDSARDLYDTCLHNKRIEASKNCTLPFFDANLTLTCGTFQEGAMAMEMISNLAEDCLLPCVQFETKIVENPILYAVSNNYSYDTSYPNLIGAHATIKDGGYEFNLGYFIHLPKYISYRKSSHNYDAISYVAEFAGWAGLFLGLSLSGCLFVILDYLQSFKPLDLSLRMFIKGIMFLVYILCMTYLAYLTVTLVSKLMENRLATSISLEESEADFDLTICKTHIIRKQVDIVHNGVLNVEFRSLITESVYSEWNKLTSKISMMVITTEDGEVENIDPVTFENVSQVNLPLTNGTMDFCHTIDLSFFQEIEKIKLYVTSEVKVFLHYPGQFLYSWYNWKNMFTSVTKDSYIPIHSGYRLYGLDITLKLEKTTFSIEESNVNFDDCFLQNLLEDKKLNNGYKQLIRSSQIDNLTGKAFENKKKW